MECVARGYLTGSGLLDYQATGKVCGITLPPGLVEASRFATPLFTPATKAALGDHDENVSFSRVIELVGGVRANQLRDRTLQIYIQAADHALTKGIIIADTKFEFGMDRDGNLLFAQTKSSPRILRDTGRPKITGSAWYRPVSTSSSSATGSPAPNLAGTATARNFHHRSQAISSRPPGDVISMLTNGFPGLSFSDWIGPGA